MANKCQRSTDLFYDFVLENHDLKTLYLVRIWGSWELEWLYI